MTHARLTTERRPAVSLSGADDLPLRLSLVLLFGLGILAWLVAIVLFRDPSQPFVLTVLASTLLLPVGMLIWASAASGRGWALLAFVFAVVFFSDASLRAKAAGSTGIDAQSLVKAIVWIGSLALMPWAFKQVRDAFREPTAALLFAFGLWATISAMYSITPIYTLAAGLSFLGIWTISAIAAYRFSIATSLTVLMGALLLALVLSLVMYGVFPDQVMTPMDNGRVLRLSGLFGSPNNLGRAAALALLLIVVYWGYGTPRARLWFALSLLPTALACLVLSGSRASLGGLVAGVLVLIARKSLPVFFLSIVVAMCSLLVALFLPIGLDDVLLAFSRTGKITEVTTFTGRTEIWAWVLSAIDKEPWLGYGFGSSQVLIPSGYSGPFGWTTTSAHNMWLQAWLTTGGVGLIVLVLSQLSTLRDVVAKAEPARDCVLAFVLVVGLMEAGPVGPSVNLLTFVWLWASMLKPPVHGPSRG